MIDNLEQRIIKIIAQISDISISGITPESSFEELGLTSLDAVTIAYELEQDLNIKVPDTEVYSINSVQELINGVRKILQVDNKS